MNLDIALLESLASRAVQLQRANDPDARMALSLYQEAATPENVLELLAKIETLEGLLGAAFGLMAPAGTGAGSRQVGELRKKVEAVAANQQKKLATLELENRELNERSRNPGNDNNLVQPELEASPERVDWKLVPVAFVEDALCAVDLIFAVRHQLQAQEMSSEDAADLLGSYARQLEDDGYQWSSQIAKYPEHPLLNLEPPHLLDEEILRDAQSWREHLYHGVEVLDVQTGSDGRVRHMLVANRTTWDQQRLRPDDALSGTGRP